MSQVTYLPSILRAMAKNYAGGHRWDHLDGEAVKNAADKIVALEAERDELSAQLELALKVPSVAAMHSYLDTECAKQNAQLGVERDRLRELLAEWRRMFDGGICSGALSTLCDKTDAVLSTKP